MKRDRHFLPPRQAVLYGYTRRMLDETAQNANSFAMEVAQRYLEHVAPDVRTVPFKTGEGDALIKAMAANGQTLRRYMDGTVKTLPADLEDAWVMSLPEPYRNDCERDLGRRRGMLPVRMPVDDGVQVASVSRLMEEFGHLMAALAPALADGVINEADRPFAHRILDEGDDMVCAALALMREVRAILPREPGRAA